MNKAIENNHYEYFWRSGFSAQLPSNIPPNATIITGYGPPSENIGKIGTIYIDLNSDIYSFIINFLLIQSN